MDVKEFKQEMTGLMRSVPTEKWNHVWQPMVAEFFANNGRPDLTGYAEWGDVPPHLYDKLLAMFKLAFV